MTLQQFLLILWARRKVVLLTFFTTVLTTLAVSLLLPKQYTADTSVVIDVKSPDPIAGMVLPGMMAPGYMATQVNIINSDRVAQRVVKLLRMEENPTVREQWLEETEGRGQMSAWLGNLLQKKLDVKPSRESNVINIGIRGLIQPLLQPLPMRLPKPISIPILNYVSNRQSNTPTGSTARSNCSAKSWKQPRARCPAISRQRESSGPMSGSTTRPRSSMSCPRN